MENRMPFEMSELRRDISLMLSSLRNIVDRSLRTGRLATPEERNRITRAILMVEEARIRYNTFNRYRDDLSSSDLREVKKDLLSFLDTFLRSNDVDQNIFDRPFRLLPPTRAMREEASPFLTAMLDSEASVADAVLSFRKAIEEATISADPRQVTMNFDDIKKIVPRQQIAPVQFSVVNNVVVILHNKPKVNSEDNSNIKSALEFIIGSGDRLIENLEQSNCDRRLLENVKQLHSQISRDENIVKIGLTNIACGMMCTEFKGELPDAINAMFSSYNASISMYVAQFPEWESFSQKAAAVELSHDDIIDIDNTASSIISTLERHPELSSPEVPKTIKFVREFLSRPGASGTRAAFALMRTIENLVSSIVHHSISVLTQTAEKTTEKLSSAGATILVGLLGIALAGATGIGGAAYHGGTPWVQQAAQMVQEQIERLSPK